MQPHHKHARVERERRFVLKQIPGDIIVKRARRITDRYIEGTALRLRQISEEDGRAIFKLTQKISARANGAQRGFITSMYLNQDEFWMLAQLPSRKLSKTRYSVAPFAIDVFEATLQGLVMAEAEFDSAAAAEALVIPPFIAREVSADDRFTGGRLVRASRQEIGNWLSEYGITVGWP